VIPSDDLDWRATWLEEWFAGQAGAVWADLRVTSRSDGIDWAFELAQIGGTQITRQGHVERLGQLPSALVEALNEPDPDPYERWHSGIGGDR